MTEGPLGVASFNNEFGRPNILGYFRSYESHLESQHYGFHKPIMIAGGLGNILKNNINKKAVPSGCCIVVLGGPSYLIGLGGGSASSSQSGSSDEDLDFASVQRANPEMQRKRASSPAPIKIGPLGTYHIPPRSKRILCTIDINL